MPVTIEAHAPGVDELLEEARSLAPLVEAQAAEADANATLSDEVGARLRDSGLTGIWVARELGGSELNLIDGHVLLEELARINGSFAWVGGAHSVAQAGAGAFLGDAAVAEIFADGLPGIAGQGLPRGKAIAADGGYVVGTTWSFGSGVKQAKYVMATSFVHEADGTPRLLRTGGPAARISYVPRDAVTLAGNWDVMGLRATGSVDYRASDLFVADEWGHALDVMTAQRGDGSIFRVGIMGLAVVVHTSWALGNGRRMLDELRDLARRGEGRFAQLLTSETFLSQFAEAEGKLRMARTFAYETLRDVQATLDRGGRPSTRQATLLRTVVARVTWITDDVVRWAYQASGTAGLRDGAIQRCYRDMGAATQHGILGQQIAVTCGTEFLGLAEGKAWLGRALVDPELIDG